MTDDTLTVSAPPAQPHPRRRLRGRITWEHALALVAALLVLVVHDVGYLLGQPYWTDESWVALTPRFPLTQLPATTSSTPIGWSLLLRLVTVDHEQTGRLLPLAFAAVAVPIGYWLARRLDWQRRDVAVVAGVLAAAAVLLVPAMLVRGDLKQYTADAATALLTVATVSRLERTWSRGGLVALSCSVWLGMLVSHTVAFVGAAAFLSVCVVRLVRRAWRELVEALVVGAVTGVLMIAVYLVFDARAVVSGLTSYWSAYYAPIAHLPSFLTHRFGAVRFAFGLGPVWLAAVLFLVGVVTLARLGRPTTAVTVLLVWPLMLVVSAAHVYPFLDLRTSTFLFVITSVVAAMGVAGLCAAVRPLLRGAPAFVLAAAALVAYGTQAQPHLRAHSIPATDEDVRDQVTYVAATAAPDDVIVVNLDSNWGFAYYWPTGTPARRPSSAVLQGYEAYFPDQPRIIVATDRTARGVTAALDDALARAARYPGARVWLVRAHLSPQERASWEAAAAGRHVAIDRVPGLELALVRR